MVISVLEWKYIDKAFFLFLRRVSEFPRNFRVCEGELGGTSPSNPDAIKNSTFDNRGARSVSDGGVQLCSALGDACVGTDWT